MHRILLPFPRRSFSMGGLLLVCSLPLAAQRDTVPLPPPPPIDIETLPSNDGSNVRLEEQAKFPGGEKALMDYMVANVRYPEEMRESGVTGRVYVGFTIATDGSIRDAQVKRGITGGQQLDEEALRVVRAMPAWRPAKVNGVPVPTEYILPVAFQLNE